MKLFTTSALMSALLASTAIADCGAGRVSIIGNDFPAIQAVAAGAVACAPGATTNLTTEHESLNVAGLTANPAEYTTAIVANSSIVPLMSAGLIRPLDDLIAASGMTVPPTQAIAINGQVMAVAFMANAQHLYTRTDILAQAGITAPPATYEEVLAAAEAIRAAGIMEYPLALNTKAGWNLAEEFVNMHLGMGGSFFVDGSAEPAINTETGVATLNMLKSLVAYSNPDFLTFDSNATQALWESGDLAIATMWGSRAGAIMDAEGSTPEIIAATALSAAPTVNGGTTPASTLWWDGWTVAANISDEDAAATFAAMMAGIAPDVVTANNDAAVWLGAGYTPGAAAAGVFATASGGAKPYPMEPYMGLMHTALGDNLAEFLQGTESAEQALADVEAAYRTAAMEQGFLQ
jgi:multiple sugar transport system substrate-binding protein